jgi:hypothetical protein
VGWFDFRKKASSPPNPGAKTPARTSRPPPETVALPEGHHITVHRAMPEPCVIRTEGGFVLANFGVAGDDPDGELDAILRAVVGMLDEEAPTAHVVNVNRQLRIDELFAPANPDVVCFRSPLMWVFHQGSVGSLCAEPRRLQALFRCVYAVGQRGGGPTQQVACLVEPPSPDVAPFTRLLRGLGLILITPDDDGGDCRVLAEVKRPEGPILCVQAGSPYGADADAPADPYARAMNEEKARACGREGELRRLEEQELAGLAERVGSAGRTSVTLRTTRLHQVILDLERRKAGMDALLSELLSQRTPLFFMKNAHDGSVELHGYGAAGNAMPLFCDRRCLDWAAEDLGRAPGSFEIATASPLQLIVTAAGEGTGMALCTFRDRKTPVYAILPGPLVMTIAKSLSRV